MAPERVNMNTREDQMQAFFMEAVIQIVYMY